MEVPFLHRLKLHILFHYECQNLYLYRIIYHFPVQNPRACLSLSILISSFIDLWSSGIQTERPHTSLVHCVTLLCSVSCFSVEVVAVKQTEGLFSYLFPTPLNTALMRKALLKVAGIISLLSVPANLQDHKDSIHISGKALFIRRCRTAPHT